MKSNDKKDKIHIIDKQSKSNKKIDIIYSLIFLVLITVFLYITRYVITNVDINCWTNLDKEVYDYISRYINVNLTKVVNFITLFGREFIIIIAILWVIFHLQCIAKIMKKDKSKTEDRSVLINLIALPSSVLLTLLVNYSLKLGIKRIRPDVMRLTLEDGYSFPSSHTICSTVFYFMLGYIMIRIINESDLKSKTSKVLKYIITFIVTVLPFLVAISRVYLGVHYFTDVSAAIVLGGIMFIISKYVYDKIYYIKI